jgi:hypothetical protein
MQFYTKDLKDLLKQANYLHCKKGLRFFWIVVNGSKTVQVNYTNLIEWFCAEIDTVQFNADNENYIGSYIIPFDLFRDAVSTNKSDVIDIGITSKVLIVQNVFVEYKSDKADLPERLIYLADTYKKNKLFTIPFFEASYQFAKDYISLDDSRRVMHGIYFDKTKNSVVGTDGKRMGFFETSLHGITESFILPLNKFLNSVRDVNNCYYQLVKRNNNDAAVIAVYGETWSYYTSTISGQYPNYRAVIPSDDRLKETLQFSKKDIESIINFIGMNKKANLMDFVFSGEIHYRKCSVKIGSHELLLTNNYYSTLEVISFNPALLMPFLNAGYTDYKNCGDFAPYVAKLNNKTSVIMPMRNR